MQIETQIHLNKFIARDYQRPLCEAFLASKVRRYVACWPRRAGKDIVAFNLCFRAALKRVSTYFYVFPTFSSGRRILWDALTNTGERVLDFLPKELVESRNEMQMRIKLTNGSVIQVVGSDNYDNVLVGTNAGGMIFSEYALQDENCYAFARPILTANDGWALFLSTPRGKNHFYALCEIAKQSDNWFYSKLTVNDTSHIPIFEIQKEIAAGEMSEELAQQEYWCDFNLGVEGSYYSKYIDRLKLNKQIGTVPYESSFKVNTVWDLGYSDNTSIIFYQIMGATVRIIDCYENSKQGLEHYVKVVRQKEAEGWIYGKHFAPHDIKVTEWGSGLSRIEKAKQLGIKFETIRTNYGDVVSALPNLSVEDGIEAVRSTFSRIWIDEKNCAKLIKALENYRQEYDAKRKVYKPYPLHDNNSHFADAMRYLCLSLPKTRDGLSADDLDRIRNEALYGNNGNLPGFFKDQHTRLY